MRRTDRREFLKTGAAAAVGAAAANSNSLAALRMTKFAVKDAGRTGAGETSATQDEQAADAAKQASTGQGAGAQKAAEKAARLEVKKGLVWDMLPEKLSVGGRMKLARACGFDVVQAPTTADQRGAEELWKAATDAGIRIDSVMNMAHWKYPLSSSDKAVVAKSVEGMKTSLQNAKLWGADAVLLVPAVVNAETTYAEAWARSQGRIREELVPMAADLQVVIAIEEVWNKFLLSPLEMSMYVDDFDSPWVKAWFDVGNVVLYGYPQDWIHTLGKSIYKVHLKDFKRKENGYAWVNLGDGDVDWAAVRQAFADVGYSGSMIAELDGGGEAYLRDVSKRIDRLVVGAA